MREMQFAPGKFAPAVSTRPPARHWHTTAIETFGQEICMSNEAG